MKTTLPQPERYVVSPAWVIQSAFEQDPPRRALLANYIRLLSLAWENKYECTPAMHEKELMKFLQLKRRQFFQMIAEMCELHWLRSERPRAGFVQFYFQHRNGETVVSVEAGSVENHTEVQKIAPLMRTEEEESLDLKQEESSSSSSTPTVQKIALDAQTLSEKKMQLLIEHLRLLFEPETYGLLEMRESFLVGIPERVLGWIAKAYQDRKRLGSPIGMIVKHITLQDAPDRYYMEKFVEILPEEYLEAVGEIEFKCAYCEERFGTREALRTHENEKHPFPCSECSSVFQTQEELQTHYEHVHDPQTRRETVLVVHTDESVRLPVREGSGLTPERAWQSVLDQLKMEIPRASFETWVRDARACRYDGNTLTIGVRNAYAREWLESRLASTVSRLLVGIFNARVAVEFIVADYEEVEA